MFWKQHGWKIGYFAFGCIVLIGLGRLFLPFWLRWTLLVAWGLGMVFIFIKHMEKSETQTAPGKDQDPS